MNGKTLIIAEAGVNHNGDMAIARQLIEAAARAGADYVKFQTFKAKLLTAKNAPKAEYQKKENSNSQQEMLQRLEISEEDHRQLIEHCKKQGINFLSTPFDLESVEFLDSLHLDIFKISSGDLTNKPLLELIAGKGKSTIISTGMSYLAEVKEAIEVLTANGLPKEKIIALHCNTEYPTPFEDVNLNAMDSMRSLGVKIGYSDHTLGIEVPIAAVAMGAVCIEKHFTLDRRLEGPDHSASLEPDELKQMVKSIRNIELALGNSEKKPSPSEQKNMTVARKSIHLLKELPAGHTIHAGDLIMKRPGNGISPMEIDQVIGKTTKKSLAADELLTWNDLQ